MKAVNKELFDRVREYLRTSPRYSITKYIRDNITKEIDESGRNPKISCPFHGTDSSASFSIVEDEHYFQCFGCGKAGDILQLMIYWEEKHEGTKPKAAVLLEKVVNMDPELRLDLKLNTIFTQDKLSVEQVLSKPRKSYKPRQVRTLHSLIELKDWMKKTGHTAEEHIRTAIVYAQRGLDPDVIRQVLLGQLVNDVIIEDMSHVDLSDYGIYLEEE